MTIWENHACVLENNIATPNLRGRADPKSLVNRLSLIGQPLFTLSTVYGPYFDPLTSESI